MSASDSSSSSHPEPTVDDIVLKQINKYDIWDQRECAIDDDNRDFWIRACETYKSTADFTNGIPLLIHQIWIGTRQPPCVWLDTWRVDFMSAFSQNQYYPSDSDPDSIDDDTDDNAAWYYRFWDNHAVKDMFMLNRSIFDAESAPQCQADILRLELLYEYGGVYIDADVVSTVRDLRPVLKQAADTGFVITYEPDTNEKPYSVLGNSVIAATPRHPLVLLLIAYIAKTYPLKRDHYGVEWVTGPLAYTKALMHTNMPITIPPSKDFYPAFHYVPNPAAIDLTAFDSYCFQFGYTCTGLSQWVEKNNRCRRAHDCSFHASIDYPLGKLCQFPDHIDEPSEDEPIPNVIHQFCFRGDEGPVRWTRTWSDTFCQRFGFSYEAWTWDRLKTEIGSFYCANLYDPAKMDGFSARLLALEIINACGGYFVPLATMFVGDTCEDSDLFQNETGIYRRGSVIGATAGACTSLIHSLYKRGSLKDGVQSPALPSYLVTDMRFSDAVAMTIDFPRGSRFLGAGEVHVMLSEGGSSAFAMSSAALRWAYDCQVPVFLWFGCKASSVAADALRECSQRVVVLTDTAFVMLPQVATELPGALYRLDERGTAWDFMVFNSEWEADRDGFEEYVVTMPFRAPQAAYLGFVAQPGVMRHLAAAEVDKVLERFETGRVFVASLKSTQTRKASAAFAAVPLVERACRELTDFMPNFDRDVEEVEGGLVKGLRGGQVAFEIQAEDDEGRVMFRSWDNGAIDCECKLLNGFDGVHVESLRCFRDGVVLHDISNTRVA